MSLYSVVSDSYDILGSGSMKAMNDQNGDQIYERDDDYDYGTMPLEGPLYHEQFCLIHSGRNSDAKDSRLCVPDQPIILANMDEDSNSYGAVLGLARGKGDTGLGRRESEHSASFVYNLKDRGLIDNAIVSLNYEDPDNRNLNSQIDFGEVNWNEIANGKKGTAFFSNLGKHQWGVMIKDLKYNNRDISANYGSKIALIDSANPGIVFPNVIFDNLLVVMKHQAMSADHHIYVEK